MVALLQGERRKSTQLEGRTMRFINRINRAADFALAITFLAILLASTGALGSLF